MNEGAVVHRLISEYRTHGNLIVAFDFDNTVYDYHGSGHDYSEVIELLREAEESGMYLMCFTAKTEDEYADVEKWLSENNIPCHAINESPVMKGTVKPYYNILLDDRAGLRGAFICLQTVLKIIKDKGV